MTDTADMVEKVGDAIEAVRLFARWNDWTSDHVPGLPIEICRWTAEGDSDCEVIARYPGRNEYESDEHLERHVREAQAQAALNTLAPMVLDMAAKAVEDTAMILPAEECCVAHGDVCAGIIRNLKEQFNAR